MKHMGGDVCPSVVMYVSVTHQIWLKFGVGEDGRCTLTVVGPNSLWLWLVRENSLFHIMALKFHIMLPNLTDWVT